MEDCAQSLDASSREKGRIIKFFARAQANAGERTRESERKS